MGKVRKLRKKYNALCAESKKNRSSDDFVSVTKSNIPASELISAVVGDVDNRSTARSTYSISKTIKSSLGGMSIQKKDKQKLRHELFLKSKSR